MSELNSVLSIENLAPNLLACEKFPEVPTHNQLQRLGPANLDALAEILAGKETQLRTRIESYQIAADQLADLSIDDIIKLARNGCNWHGTVEKTPEEIAEVHPRKLAYFRNCRKDCVFGTRVAEICKPVDCICEDPEHTTCGKTCHTCFCGQPFAQEECIFMEGLDEQRDQFVGELIAMQMHYQQFYDQLKPYQAAVRSARETTKTSMPLFAPWHKAKHFRAGMSVTLLKPETYNGVRRVSYVRAIFLGRVNGTAGNGTVTKPPVALQTTRGSHKLTTNSVERIISDTDRDFLRSNPGAAKLWLDNFTGRTFGEDERELQSLLKQSMREYLQM